MTPPSVVRFLYVLILVKLQNQLFIFCPFYFTWSSISPEEHILAMDRQLINILLMGIAFMTLFIAFQTTSVISVWYSSR